MSNIVLFAEQRDGAVKKASLAALTFARQLAEKSGGQIHIVTLGPGAGAAAESLKGFGAAAIHTNEGEAFAKYLAQPYTVALAAAAEATGASFVVGPATSTGKDMLPRVAARLGAGMASDVAGLAGDGTGTFKRPMFAGNLVQTITVHTDKKVLSIRATEFSAAEATGGESAVQELAVEVPAEAQRARFVSFDEEKSDRPELTDASVVVSGGRGLKGPEGFTEQVEPLADALGAAIGASRAVCDAGWVPNDWQVGQTGKVVAPDLYIAVGISGAIQHVAGMRGSKTIVAINKDEEAPIFNISDYGLVADLFKVVPELTEGIKKVKSQG